VFKTTMSRFFRNVVLPALLFCALAVTACVSVDPQTGATLPRGGQRYQFDEVKSRAEHLEQGMSKQQVMLLLGSPAESETNGDVWIYLPERKAAIVPGRALRLQFDNGLLVEHGYRTIVLGTH